MSIIYSRDVYFKVPFRSVPRILFCRTFPAMKNAMSEKLDHSNIPSLIYSSDDYHYWTVRSGMKIIYSVDVYSIVPFRSIQFQELRILFFCCRTYPPMYSIVWDPNLIETHLKVEFYYSDVSVFIIRSIIIIWKMKITINCFSMITLNHNGTERNALRVCEKRNDCI